MNSFPVVVQEKINELLSGLSLDRLSLFSKKLTEFYQQKRSTLPEIASKDEHLAYLACRMPATYAALVDVFQRIQEICPDYTPKSLLDFGAGPGTSFLAAQAVFETLQNGTLVERDSLFIELAKKYLPQEVTWLQKDLCKLDTMMVDPADLVVVSYALGELHEIAQRQLIDVCFKKSNHLIVLVEPGTPRGYEVILKARTKLLELGVTLVAPCPHHGKCPLLQNDWCHFATRLPRTSLHRKVKGAALSFEDEKFSYLVASKQPKSHAPYDRILRPPQKHSGHLQLTLCTSSETFCQKTISKRDKESFVLAKKAGWGDILSSKSSPLEDPCEFI